VIANHGELEAQAGVQLISGVLAQLGFDPQHHHNKGTTTTKNPKQRQNRRHISQENI
jgi:hypothetical protein